MADGLERKGKTRIGKTGWVRRRMGRLDGVEINGRLL